MTEDAAAAARRRAIRAQFGHSCTCRHDDDRHERRTGPCRDKDSYGQPCQCTGFEHSPECIEVDSDGDDSLDEDEADLGDDPRYHRLIVDDGHVDPVEPE